MKQIKKQIKSLSPTIILAILGLLYLAVPHSIHVSSGIDLGLNHNVHIIIGVVLLAVAGLVYWKMK